MRILWKLLTICTIWSLDTLHLGLIMLCRSDGGLCDLEMGLRSALVASRPVDPILARSICTARELSKHIEATGFNADFLGCESELHKRWDGAERSRILRITSTPRITL